MKLAGYALSQDNHLRFEIVQAVQDAGAIR